MLGFEPLLQFIHPEDVTRALGHALVHDLNGAYNVAATPPLPLLKALALAGVPPLFLPHPLAYRGWGWLRGLSSQVDKAAPLPWDFLRFSWVASTTRLEEEGGFQSQHDAASILQQFGQALRRRRYAGSRVYRVAADRLRDALDLGRKLQGGAVAALPDRGGAHV